MRIQEKGLWSRDGVAIRPKLLRMGVMDKIKHPQVRSVCLSVLAEKKLNLLDKKVTAIQEKSAFYSVDLNQQINEINDQINKLREALAGRVSEEINELNKKKSFFIEKLIEKKKLKFDKKENLEQIEEKIIREAEIICCTLNSAGSEKLDRIEHSVEAIIIDEAAQATEPTTLIPMRFKANKIILVGDPMQLPATTFGRHSNSSGYNRSLFERIVSNGLPIDFLDTQYRMLPSLRMFPSNEFYGGRLNDCEALINGSIPNHLAFLKGSNHLFFDTSEFHEQRVNNSIYNEAEIDACFELIIGIKNSLQTGINQKTVAIISPYREQVRRIRERLAQDIDNGILEVNTIDAFQGQEKDIIIFSSVRSNRERSIGFLSDTRRLNVALTRAKYGLFVIGSSHALSSNPTWNRLLKHMREEKKIIRLKSKQSIQSIFSMISSPSKSKIKQQEEINILDPNYEAITLDSDDSGTRDMVRRSKNFKPIYDGIQVDSPPEKKLKVQSPKGRSSKGGLGSLISKTIPPTIPEPPTSKKKLKDLVGGAPRQMGIMHRHNDYQNNQRKKKKSAGFDIEEISKNNDFYNRMND